MTGKYKIMGTGRAVFYAAILIVAAFRINARAELVDRIVAVVGGEIITLSELKQFNAQSPDLEQEKVLELLIEDLLIEQEARRQGITISDAEVEASLQSQMAQLGVSEEEFGEMMKSEGVTIVQLKERIRSKLIKFKFVQQQIRGGIDLSEEEMLNFYKKNPDLFRAAAKAHLGHIFLPFPMSRNETQMGKARALAADLHKRISEGEDFGELSEQYSKGGGDLGWLRPDEMMPSFARAIKGLEAEEVSEPFETDQGVHLLKVIEFKESEVMSFEDVRDRIYAYLYDQRIQEELFRLVRDIKERTPIERKL